MTEKKVGRILAGFGLGSVLAFYLYILCQRRLLSLKGIWQEVIRSGQISVDMASIRFFSIILPVGLICLFLVPILIVKNKKTGIKLSLLLMLTVMVAAGNVIAVASGTISFIHTVVLWIYSIYLCSFIVEGIQFLYDKVGNVLKFSTLPA